MKGGENIAWAVGLAGGAAAIVGGLILLMRSSSSASNPPAPNPHPNPPPGGPPIPNQYICPDGSTAPDPSQCTYPGGTGGGMTHQFFHVISGKNPSGVWQELQRGWEPDDGINEATAPMLYGEYNWPTFEWIWAASSNTWSNRSWGM